MFYLTTILQRAVAQWRAEGGGEGTGRRLRASKAGGHPKSEVTKIKML